MNYLDTSVFVPLYTDEPLTPQVVELVRNEGVPAISPLTELEWYSSVGRRVRAGELSREDADRAFASFLINASAGAYERVAITDSAYAMAGTFLRLFAAALKAPDALHLAIAAASGFRLVTADRQLAAAARVHDDDVRLVNSPVPGT